MRNSPNQMPKRYIPLDALTRDISIEYEDDLVASPEGLDPRAKGFVTKTGSIIIDTFRPMDYFEIPEGEVVDDEKSK